MLLHKNKLIFSCFWTVPPDPQPEPQTPVSSAPVMPSVPQLPTPDALAAVAQLFQSPHGQEVSNNFVLQQLCIMSG